MAPHAGTDRNPYAAPLAALDAPLPPDEDGARAKSIVLGVLAILTCLVPLIGPPVAITAVMSGRDAGRVDTGHRFNLGLLLSGSALVVSVLLHTGLLWLLTVEIVGWLLRLM